MRIGQALFPLEIEPGIPRVRPWKELLATGAQTTWLYVIILWCVEVKTYQPLIGWMNY